MNLSGYSKYRGPNGKTQDGEPSHFPAAYCALAYCGLSRSSSRLSTPTTIMTLIAAFYLGPRPRLFSSPGHGSCPSHRRGLRSHPHRSSRRNPRRSPHHSPHRSPRCGPPRGPVSPTAPLLLRGLEGMLKKKFFFSAGATRTGALRAFCVQSLGT